MAALLTLNSAANNQIKVLKGSALLSVQPVCPFYQQSIHSSRDIGTAKTGIRLTSNSRHRTMSDDRPRQFPIFIQCAWHTVAHLVCAQDTVADLKSDILILMASMGYRQPNPNAEALQDSNGIMHLVLRARGSEVEDCLAIGQNEDANWKVTLEEVGVMEYHSVSVVDGRSSIRDDGRLEWRLS